MTRQVHSEFDRLQMDVLLRSEGSRMDLWFVDSEPAQQVSGVLSTMSGLLSMTTGPGHSYPSHGSFKAQVYTPTGLRAFAGFAVRSAPNTLRLFPLGTIVHRERRRSIRVPLDIPVAYRLLGFNGHDLSSHGGQGSGRSVDVGVSGMAFTTSIRLPEGLVIGLTSAVSPWSGFGEIECTVNRFEQTVTGWITAVRFNSPSQQLKDHLKQYLLQKSRASRNRAQV